MVLLTFDEAGNKVIESHFAGSGEAEGASLVQAADNGFMLAGSTQADEAQPRDVYLVRTDSAGDSVWEIIHGGDGEESGGPMTRSNDGGYVMAGSTTSFGAGGKDLYILKVMESGM